MACSVCSSQEIYEIWRELSNEEKTYFYTETGEKLFPLLRFWALILGGSHLEIDAHQQYAEKALERAADFGLLQAVRYLFALSTENGMIILTGMVWGASPHGGGLIPDLVRLVRIAVDG